MKNEKPKPKKRTTMMVEKLGAIDELVFERVRIFYANTSRELRALEEYKLKRGICVLGISCTRKAIEGKYGGHRGCPHHTALLKSGVKVRLNEAYASEYRMLRDKQREEEKLAAKREAEEKEAKKVRKFQRPIPPPPRSKRSAA